MDYICSDGDDGLVQSGLFLYNIASVDDFFLSIALVDGISLLSLTATLLCYKVIFLYMD